MKNNSMMTIKNLEYIEFVPHTEQHSGCDEEDHSATAVLVHGCILHCELHTVRR
jgi:hypothetical protein